MRLALVAVLALPACSFLMDVPPRRAVEALPPHCHHDYVPPVVDTGGGGIMIALAVDHAVHDDPAPRTALIVSAGVAAGLAYLAGAAWGTTMVHRCRVQRGRVD